LDDFSTNSSGHPGFRLVFKVGKRKTFKGFRSKSKTDENKQKMIDFFATLLTQRKCGLKYLQLKRSEGSMASGQLFDVNWFD
jgi:hypothetical protein